MHWWHVSDYTLQNLFVVLSNTCTKTLENENIFIKYKQKYSFQHSFENLFATSSYKLNVKLTLVLQIFFNRKSRTSLGQDFFFSGGGGCYSLFFSVGQLLEEDS